MSYGGGRGRIGSEDTHLGPSAAADANSVGALTAEPALALGAGAALLHAEQDPAGGDDPAAEPQRKPAQVIAPSGAAWLERESRAQQEKPEIAIEAMRDALLGGQALQPPAPMGGQGAVDRQPARVGVQVQAVQVDLGPGERDPSLADADGLDRASRVTATLDRAGGPGPAPPSPGGPSASPGPCR